MIDLENASIREAEQAAYAAGDTLKANGLICSPHQLISINWEVDNASGSTECEAWRGQHEIDCLTRTGYTVRSIEPHF